MGKAIYLDNAGTTKIKDSVKKDIIEALDYYGNPSSIYKIGIKNKNIIEDAREKVKGFIGANENDIVVFTGSGSEANNLAIQGFYKGNLDLTDFIVPPTEHSSVRNIGDYFETERNLRVWWAISDSDYRIDVDNIDWLIKDIKKSYIKTGGDILISVMYANNETGVVNDIGRICDIAHQYKDVYVHCDATQGVGHASINVKDLGVDMLSFSCHKMGMPKGIGVLYISENVKDMVQPIVYGGSQENGYRAGTENIPYIYALGNLCKSLSYSVYYDKYYDRQNDLNLVLGGIAKKIMDYFENKLENDPELKERVWLPFSKSPSRSSTISPVIFRGYNANQILTGLSGFDIYVSAGSACNAHLDMPSRTLMNLGFKPEDARSMIRFSFSDDITEDDVNEVISKLKVVLRLIDKKS